MTSCETNQSALLDRDEIDQLFNITETLVNLNYLIAYDPDKPELVQSYARQSQERLQTLGKLLQSIG